MPGKAKSQAQKNREVREEWEAVMEEAVKVYAEEQTKGKDGKGARAVANEVMDAHLKKTGNAIKLSYNTIIERYNGRASRSDAAEDRRLLTDAETDMIINYTIHCANQGFPLSHRRLKEHIDEILQARLGPSFLGIGKKFTQRFVTENSNQLKATWSVPLESQRANAVNEYTNRAWWKLIGETIEENNILSENMYAADEVGVQPYGMERERVIGPKRAGPQYQRRTGNRENFTVIVTICADGTSTAPVVIFKGKGYQVKWLQDNPANASIGYSKKGWTDQEIGLDWLKLLDEETKKKANGKARLLILDGHTSHYGRPFLEHARENNIIVICYPAHTTHIYQGLDVVIFATLKLRLSQERDAFVREHMAEITKENILQIYGKAHIASLTSENIKAAFRKTGLHPFNPNVIDPIILEPSKPTSLQSNLPVSPATPMKLIATMLRTLSAEDDVIGLETVDDEKDGSCPPSPSEAQYNRRIEIVKETAKKLARTQLKPLLEPTINSDDPPAVNRVKTPSELINRKPSPTLTTLLAMIPSTQNETLLLAALRETQKELEYYKDRVIQLQAANIINEAYCNKLQAQIQERLQKAKKNRKGKLLGDGMPKVLSGDAFYKEVVEFTERKLQEDVEKARKVNARALWQTAVQEWENSEIERKEENTQRSQRNKLELEKWEKARAAAKKAKKLFTKQKPEKEPLLKAQLKPKLKDFEASTLPELEDDISEEEDEEDDSEDSNEESE